MKTRTHSAGSPATQPTHGETLPVMSDGRAPRLPHERDESSSSQASPPRKVMQQAAKDLENGLQDGSMGPPMDATYHREFRQPESDAKAKASPQRDAPAQASKPPR